MNLLERLIRLREVKRAMRKKRFGEALDLLSRPPLAALKDAERLREQVFQLLMDRARHALQAGDLADAREALTIARQAGHDQDPSAELMARLTTAERERGLDPPHRDEAWSELRRDLASGSLAGARNKLDVLAANEQGEVGRMRRWLDARARDLDRYLDRARRAMEAEDDTGAREAVERAEALFPSHPDVHTVRSAIDARQRRVLRDEILNAVGSDSPEALWTRYRDAIRRNPPLRDDAELAPVRARLERETLHAVREAITAGKPDLAQEVLRAMHEHASEESRALLGGVQLWVRARECVSAGEVESAAELLRAARDRVGSPRAVRQELQRVEAAIDGREEALSRIEEALENGDDQRAATCIDAAIDAGTPAPWLPALRRAVASRLDAGTTALLEIRQMVREGRVHDARLSLIPLLGQKQTHESSLELWKEVTAREEAAARLLGRAEAVALDPAAGKADLVDALRAIEESMHHRRDQARATELRKRLTDQQAAWERYEEAIAFADAGRPGPAIERCRVGLASNPTHEGLQRLVRSTATGHAADLLRRAEARLAAGDENAARSLLEDAQDLTALDPTLPRRIDRLAAQCQDPVAARPEESLPVSLSAPDHEPDLTRFMLRVEEGPEALVLTESTVHLGNARNPDNHIALMANISSNHATIRRETSFHGGITYVLRAREGRECEVNGRRAREATLENGDEIRLGRDVVLRFSLPDPGSASARIEIARGYHIDEIRNVLLMKGPGKDGRIRIRGGGGAHLPHDHTDRTVWIYLEQPVGEHRPSLFVEADGTVEVDGEVHERRAPVAIGTYVCCGPCRFQVGSVT